MRQTEDDVNRDIERGESAEFFVQKYIKDRFDLNSRIVKEDIRSRDHIDIKILPKEKQTAPSYVYDNFIQKYGRYLEIKHDETASKTGNIYLEIWSNARKLNPGTILQCRAHSIWYVLKNEIIIFSREALISWLITHLYFNSEDSENWKKTTAKESWKDLIERHIKNYNTPIDRLGLDKEKKLKLFLMPAGINEDVRGILIPIRDIKKLKENIGLIEIIYLQSIPRA